MEIFITRYRVMNHMRLHDYATHILGSKFTMRVLKTLLHYRGKVFTIRELARLSDISHPAVSKVTKELEVAGVVKLQPVGKAYQIMLNDESYILKSMIEPMFKAEQQTVKELIATIKPFFKNEKIISVAIFGSVARSQEGRTSDVDLLIVTKDKEVANECAAKASSATLSTFGSALSPLIMDKKQLKEKRNKKLVNSILKSHLLVSGKDLEEMLSSD